MAQQKKTPGVYVEEKSTLPPSVAGVATAIPVFIGYTQKGNVNEIKLITSLLEYKNAYGEGATIKVDEKTKAVKNTEFVMFDSIRMFYDNGGGSCYVVSIGNYDSTLSKDGKAYTDVIDNVLDEQKDITILLFPDAATILDAAALGTVQQKALDYCAAKGGKFAILDLKRLDPAAKKDKTKSEILKAEMLGFRNNVKNNLCYGAAYYPYLKSIYSKTIDFKEVIAALDKVEYNGDNAPEKFAEKVANVAKSTDSERPQKINALIPQIKGYAEKLEELEELASIIPPSGAMAGIYAATDNRVGVWQAPANVGVTAVKGLTQVITDAQQEDMNVDTETAKSINAIREFNGKGTLVWGARTLDGGSNEWRYVSVRRLFNYVEQSVKNSTSWAVFQPNDTGTWVKIKCQVSNFLNTLWRDGALAGASAEEAYFVEVGKGITMDQDDINNGKLIVRIGLAAVRPAEFIILEFSHKVE